MHEQLNDVLIHESAEVYHAQAANYLSSHQLGDFRKCPQLYWKKRAGISEEIDRPAYLVGRAVHALVLEGQKVFNQQFAVGGPVNPKTGQTYGSTSKAFLDWKASQNREVLTQTQYDLVRQINDSVQAHEEVVQLLSSGEAEGVVRAEYCGVPCQIRMDWFDVHQGIVDLKTCDDLTWFEADAKRYGYQYQLAFYRAVLAQRIGLIMPVHMIAVEKKEPFRTGLWKLTSDCLDSAQRENEAAIERLKLCRQREFFPTGYEQKRVLELI